jgi:hypothetical protein
MGVVPECSKKLDNHWTTCASYKVFEIEEGSNKYKVTCPMNKGYQTNYAKSMNVFVHAECGKNTGIHVLMQWLISGSIRRQHYWKLCQVIMLAISISTHIIMNL